MADANSGPTESGMEVEDKNAVPTNENITIAPSVMATLDRQKKSGSHNHSGSGGSGNNSDNSGLVSMGNNSFGFNFDNEDSLAGSGNNSDQSEPKDKTNIALPSTPMCSSLPENVPSKALNSSMNETKEIPEKAVTEISSKTSLEDAAAAAVANLRSVVKSASVKWENDKTNDENLSAEPKEKHVSKDGSPNKQASFQANYLHDEFGYDSDDEADDEATARAAPQAVGSKGFPPDRKKKKIDNFKREERNAREKERSFRISRQINELRTLLSSGGVIVPKGTKSSVLTEAANYIRMLQQHQYRSEIDRHQLIQQMQMIGAGALGPQAASAIRHVAVQNGVWSLGNFGGVPPRSAMGFYNDDSNTNSNSEVDVSQIKEIEEHEYRHVFNSCAVAMAIASMGGAFIDCNELFCQLSQYTKQEVCAMTIFNMTSRSDLQHAFDLISQMISPPPDSQSKPPPCVLQGSMKHRSDLGLSISLVKGGEDGIAKCFCVTLVKHSTSFSPRPTPALSDLVPGNLSSQGTEEPIQKQQGGSDMSSPAYTTG